MNSDNKKVKYPIVELQAIASAIAGATTVKDIELVVSREGITLNLEAGAKWRMLTDVFIKCDENSFFRMLAEFLYFTNDEQEEEIKKILGRHGIHIEFTEDNDWFIVDQTKETMNTQDEWDAYEANKKAEKQVKSDENLAEKIRGIREHHQAYIDVIEQFCKDYKNPSRELNEAYIYLENLLTDELKELGISPYCPFKDLYSAEKEYTPEPMEIRLDGRPATIDWNYFRPRLYSVHSQIVQLLSSAKTTTKTETKVQEINSFVSRLRDEQIKIDKSKNKPSKEKVGKIEIVSLPPVRIKTEKDKPFNPHGVILLGKQIEYDETKSLILVAGKSCPLPPAKNEDYLAKAMFNRPIGEFVDWSLIYSEVTGSEVDDGIKNQKTIRDTMDRLNKRVQEIIGTAEELFTWQNKSLKRNY